MPVTFRKAAASDIDAVTAIYDAIIAEEEAGRAVTGWKRGVYPVRATAEAALTRGDLFVAELDGRVAAAAVLNQIQVDVYAGAPWEFEAPDEEIFVMHTLVVDPAAGRRGLGRAFETFYEALAREYGCRFCALTPMYATRGRGRCIKNSATRRSPSPPARSTVLMACSSCCWKRHCNKKWRTGFHPVLRLLFCFWCFVAENQHSGGREEYDPAADDGKARRA